MRSGGGSNSSGTATSGVSGDGGGSVPTYSGGPAPEGGCGTTPKAGNPDGSCSAGIPSGGQPADVSLPTTVVGTGTAASCTFGALDAAVAKGGVITFDCGCVPVTIAVTATMNVPSDRSTVIDGGNEIVLDGGNAVRILNFYSANYRTNENRLTLQHISLVNGKTTPMDAIPTAVQAACSQGWDDGQGGAVYMRDGNLTVIDSIFTNNHAAPVGPDTGGGAIYVDGSKHGILIVSSTFESNGASNAGAVGALNSELDVYDSTITGNVATGHDANDDDATKCSAMNNGQNETGSGGNGGALYMDGDSVGIIACGDSITGNAAGTAAFGGGVFMTSDDLTGNLTITDSTITGNTGGSWGGAGTAIGVNAKTITITNSTVQGYP
jgi:hypothetical protein